MANQTLKQFPASVRVIQAIQHRISNGHYVAGAWLPAERDLAVELSVSRPVVRDALARLVEEGLISRSRGCRPRINGDTSNNRSSNHISGRRYVAKQTIAAVIPHQPAYFTAHAILRGINQTLFQSEAPFQLTTFDTFPHSGLKSENFLASLEHSVLAKVDHEGLAGIIIWHLAGEETLPELIKIQERGVPVVFIDRYPAGYDCDFVGVDNRTGVRNAVEHLLDQGHRRIAYLTNSEKITTVSERLEGFKEAFLLKGILPAQELIYVNPAMYLKTDWGPAVQYFRSLASPPTAAVVLSDLQAFSFMYAARAQGWRVPEDISIVGFDDIECYSPHPPMLTTVHQPFYQIGQRAAELMLRRLGEPERKSVRSFQHVCLSTSLVLRETCRSLQSRAA